MSSTQLEDRREREYRAWIAAELGIEPDELDRLEWTIDETTANDGFVYGHIVTFDRSSDTGVLAKVRGLNGGSFVQIGFPPEEAEPE